MTAMNTREASRKINLPAIVDSTIKELKEIEGSSANQSQKTKLFNRLATKVKTRLYEDGRKSEDQKITLHTYKRYMSTIRNAIKGALSTHHNLQASIAKVGTLERIIRDYPEYNALLLPLRTEPASTIGLLHKSILATVLKDTDNKKRNAAYKAIKELKINHEFLYQLKMDDAEKAEYSDLATESLETKKTNTITLNESDIMKIINDNINSASYAKRSFALALASGRRPIELLLIGAFKPKSEYTVLFEGQAKKQTGVEMGAFPIYTLIPANEFIKAMDSFRTMEAVKALLAFNELEREARTIAVNARTASPLNQIAKDLLNDKQRSFKDSRAIYTRMCLDKYQASSGLDEDAFTKQLLGHANYEAQAHYKQFIIDYTNSTVKEQPNSEPIIIDEPIVIDAKAAKKKAKELDAVTKAIESYVAQTGRNGIQAYHQKVIEWATLNPSAKLTQTALNKGIGGNRQTVKRYLEEAAPLEIETYNQSRK